MSSIAVLRDRFFSAGEVPLPSDLRPAIISSWARSLEDGVDRSLRSTQVLPRPHPSSELDELVLNLTGLLELFSEESAAGGQCCLISDEEARPVWLGGDRRLARLAASRNVVVDADCSEHLVGTNGVGTALASREVTHVSFAEHVCDGWQDVACIAAPIRNPVTGQVAGVFNASGRRAPSPRTIMQAIRCARMLEQEWHLSVLRRAISINSFFLEFARGSGGQPVLALDRWGYVVGMNATATSLLDIGLQELARPSLPWPLPANWRRKVIQAARQLSEEGPLAIRNFSLSDGDNSLWSVRAVYAEGSLTGIVCAAEQPSADAVSPPTARVASEKDGLRSPREANRLVGLREGRMELIEVRSIMGASFRGRNVVLRTKDTTYISTYRTLSDLVAILPCPPFFLANRSDAVNLRFVREIVSDGSFFELVLGDAQSTVVPVSRRRVAALRDYIHF